jgi:uncharacterized Tic20 family protein
MSEELNQDMQTAQTNNVEPDKDARNWGMICHLSGFFGFIVPFGNVLGPLIVWSIKKGDHPFIEDQGMEALNFQLTVALCFIVSCALVLLLIGIMLIPVIVIYSIVMIIIASIKANEGEYYRYPITIRFFK